MKVPRNASLGFHYIFLANAAKGAIRGHLSKWPIDLVSHIFAGILRIKLALI